jgi:large conductance mechanosensitive channel
VVTSIVDNLISPLIGMIGGVPDLSGLLAFTVNNSTVSFGAILNALINFLLIGVAVYFCVILPINKLRDITAASEQNAQDGEKAEEAMKVKPSVEEQTLATLQEIRDELRKSNA